MIINLSWILIALSGTIHSHFSLCFSVLVNDKQNLILKILQGGTLWFQNLTEYPHGVVGPILPLLIAGLHFANVQVKEPLLPPSFLVFGTDITY